MRSQSLSFLVTARCLAPLAGLALTLAAAPTFAQDAAADDKAPALRVTNEALLDDFAHYVLIARPDLAESSAAQLLDRVTDAKEFANLVEEGDLNRFMDATSRAQKLQGNANLQALSGALLKMYDKGRLERARDPKQIAENIALLTGGQRGKLMGRQGLLQAGEYAMPQLLEAYLQDRDAALSVETQSVMIGLGRQAIVPLITGLLSMTPTQQEKVVRVLGQLGYKMSVPALADLHGTTTSDQVRSACDRALQQLQAQPGDPAPLYRQLAEAYYSENSEVTNFPGEDFQLLWDFDPAVGLTMNAIRTPVFHEAMAMRLTERAMELESANGSVNPDSLALWVASNYSREADTPQGYINPAYPVVGAAADGAEPRRSAEYFGVAVGGDVASRVLGRALSEKDTPLVRRALAAVEQTAGGRVALTQAGASSPLVSALTYPNRRVQTEAALAVSAAAPTTDFAGSDRVVPILSSAVAAGTDQFAVVLSPDAERYQPMRAMLEKMGYKVLPAGESLTELSSAIGEAPNVDLIIVTGFGAERSTQTIGEARGFTRTAATPMLVLTSPEVYAEQQRRFEADQSIALRPVGTGEDSLTKTIESLVDTAAGGRVSSEEADAYAMRSLSALRDLAMAGNPVLKVTDAAGPLMGALPAAEGARREGIATVLSMVGQERAQRSLFDAASASEGEDRAMLIAQTTESAKRFGNMLEQRQVDELVVMAGSENEAEATAAAALMGALNLPNRNLMPLILGKGSGMVGQR